MKRSSEVELGGLHAGEQREGGPVEVSKVTAGAVAWEGVDTQGEEHAAVGRQQRGENERGTAVGRDSV